MEILFFRIFKHLAGVKTAYLIEVVHTPVVQPFLPITPFIKELLIHHGRTIGVVDLSHLLHIKVDSGQGDIVVLRCENVEFGIRVKKIFSVRAIPSSRMTPPHSKTFIPSSFIESVYRIKSVDIPIISPAALLHHSAIESFWMDAKKQA